MGLIFYRLLPLHDPDIIAVLKLRVINVLTTVFPACDVNRAFMYAGGDASAWGPGRFGGVPAAAIRAAEDFAFKTSATVASDQPDAPVHYYGIVTEYYFALHNFGAFQLPVNSVRGRPDVVVKQIQLSIQKHYLAVASWSERSAVGDLFPVDAVRRVPNIPDFCRQVFAADHPYSVLKYKWMVEKAFGQVAFLRANRPGPHIGRVVNSVLPAVHFDVTLEMS